MSDARPLLSAGPGINLILIRWHGSRLPLQLRFDASLVSALADAEVVGEVELSGEADLGGKDIVVKLSVRGHTREICGRTLEDFEHPFDIPFNILIKKSNSVHEIEWDDDEEDTFQVTVPEEERELDISEAVRQCIELERPISPVRPGAPLPEGVLPDDVPVERPIDPRWDALRGLKDN